MLTCPLCGEQTQEFPDLNHTKEQNFAYHLMTKHYHFVRELSIDYNNSQKQLTKLFNNQEE